MKALQITTYGQKGVAFASTDAPTPKKGTMLIKVHRAALKE